MFNVKYLVLVVVLGLLGCATVGEKNEDTGRSSEVSREKVAKRKVQPLNNKIAEGNSLREWLTMDSEKDKAIRKYKFEAKCKKLGGVWNDSRGQCAFKENVDWSKAEIDRGLECKRSGGQWVNMSNGCVDKCFSKKMMCLSAITPGCNCGPDKCQYNGTCIMNPPWYNSGVPILKKRTVHSNIAVIAYCPGKNEMSPKIEEYKFLYKVNFKQKRGMRVNKKSLRSGMMELLYASNDIGLKFHISKLESGEEEKKKLMWAKKEFCQPGSKCKTSSFFRVVAGYPGTNVRSQPVRVAVIWGKIGSTKECGTRHLYVKPYR